MASTLVQIMDTSPRNPEYLYSRSQWAAVENVLMEVGVIPGLIAAGSRDETRVWTQRPRFPRNVAALHAELDVELHMLGAHGATRLIARPGLLAGRYERRARQLATLRRELETDPLMRRSLPALADLEHDFVNLAAALRRPSRGRPKVPRQRDEFCLALLRLWHFGFRRRVSAQDEPLIRFMLAAAAPAREEYPLTESVCEKFIKDHRDLLPKLDINEYIQLQDLF